MSQPEADLKRAIIEALHRMGLMAFRNEQGSRRYKAMGCGVGSPDIFVVLRPSGRLVGLEAKTEKGKPSPNQVAWGEQLEQHGGAYRVVTSVAEAIAAVREAQTQHQGADNARRIG